MPEKYNYEVQIGKKTLVIRSYAGKVSVGLWVVTERGISNISLEVVAMNDVAVIDAIRRLL